MPLPLNALSTEELEHYSGIELGASQELARRIALGHEAEQREVERLEERLEEKALELGEVESELSLIYDQLGNLTKAAIEARVALQDFIPLAPDGSPEREAANKALKALEKLI